MDPDNGYIRYTNGWQIAWVARTVQTKLESWGSVYYQNFDDLPAWKKAFTSIIKYGGSVDYSLYWYALSEPTIDGPEQFKILRGTKSDTTVRFISWAEGSWV